MNFKNLNSVWIWRDNSTDPNQYVTFKQSFELASSKARLFISCDTNYAAYLNGSLVGFGQYAAYPQNKYYDVLELDGYAKAGSNVLTIDVYYQGVSTSCYKKGHPGLIYSVLTPDGHIANTNVLCKKTPGYKEGSLPLITNQIGPSFYFDATEDDENWYDVCILDFSKELPPSFRKRPVKKLVAEEHTKFKPCGAGSFEIKTISQNPAERISTAYSVPFDTPALKPYLKNDVKITKDNTYLILDLGGEASGHFCLELVSPSKVRIDIAFGEHLLDGRVRAKIGDNNFAFTYLTKQGLNKFVSYFRRIGAKYLQLNFSNVNEPVILRYAGLLLAEYPIKEAPMPNLTDTLDRKIYNASLKTLKLCMHEHYEDSPWRGQTLYSLDARNQSLFGYYVFKDSEDFAKASIELFASYLENDGLFNMASPFSSKTKIPSFTLMWLVWISEYVKHTKDKSYLMLNEKRISKIIISFEKRMNNQGLITLPIEEGIWNFYDSVAGLDDVRDKETDALINLYFCLALKKLMEVEKHFRNKELIMKIRKLYKELKASVNKNFYDRKKKLYFTFLDDQNHICKLSQALALLSETAKNKSDLRKKLVYDNTLTDLTLCTKQFEYEALLPEAKKYGDYILKNIRKIWGKMIFSSADTMYETPKGASDFGGAGSLCHGYSALPAYWYHILFGGSYFKSK